MVERFAEFVDGELLDGEKQQRVEPEGDVADADRPPAGGYPLVAAGEARPREQAERMAEQRMAEVQERSILGGTEHGSARQHLNEVLWVEHHRGKGAIVAPPTIRAKRIVDDLFPLWWQRLP